MAHRTPDWPATVIALEGELADLTRAFSRLHRDPDASEQMPRSAYLLARALAEMRSASLNELASATGIDASTLTRQVAPMEAAGFVERVTDPLDGRIRRIRLTAAGRRAMRRLGDLRRRKLMLLTRDWSEDEQATFAALLGRFNRALRDSSAAEIP